ncbi:MAG: UDP-N-acetylmuramoyl-L-alanine--D-glutamate ligase, partial [Eggerthellaceae bacterium]|nr:UDP-N-acetylmuramoyl-L-alanine--D-glutamate ligase [Eggerthellaceae bacterium]
AVAVVLGVPDAAIAQALSTFPPLEHRIEPCGTVAGAACYNDSKATNVDAAVKALGAFPGKRVVVLLGGDDKDTDLSDLIEAAHEHASVAVLFGAGRPRFAAAFAEAAARYPEEFQVLEANHLEDALDVALDAASAGDVVLLSPACASFDEFKSFEERGTVFKRLVADRMRSRGA